MPPIKKRPSKTKGYQPVDTEGKLYRVRDKDYGDGNPPKVWGENLTYEAAHLLKEKTVGAGKSRTARIEEMSIPMPGADPVLESVRQKGLAVARGAASAAQARADQLAARRKRDAQAASAPRPRVPPKPVPMKMDLVEDDDDGEFDVPDVVDESDEQEHPEQVAADVVADDDINEYEARGKDLYEKYSMLVGGTPGNWATLAPRDQAAFSFEATAEQGPHVDAVKAGRLPDPAESPPDATNGAPATS